MGAAQPDGPASAANAADAAGVTVAASVEQEAAALFELSRFVDWPDRAFPSRDAPFVIGILGADPFGRRLDEVVRGRRVHGRPIVVRRFRNIDEYEPSQILFVAASKARLIGSILDFLDFLGQRGVLTVSESDGFIRGGGILRLEARDGGVAFEVNRVAARAAGLTLHAGLLDLAGEKAPGRKAEAMR